jgi:hypothetical protein
LTRASLYQLSVVVILICFGAIIIEIIVFANTEGASARAAARAGIVTSLISAVSGAAGLRYKHTLAIPELGLAAGVIGLCLSVLLEALSRASWTL